MTYATQMQIQQAAGGADRLIALVDWTGSGTLDSDGLAVIADAQASAESWMHDFLRDRFTVPITPTTTSGAATLAAISQDETVYVLHKRRGMLTDLMEKHHAEREAQLKAFADGMRRPDDPLPAKSTAIIGGIVEREGPLTRRGLRGVW